MNSSGINDIGYASSPGGVEEICSRVEDSLYFSAKKSLVKYLGIIIEREVLKTVSMPETDLILREASFIFTF